LAVHREKERLGREIFEEEGGWGFEKERVTIDTEATKKKSGFTD